MSILVDAEKTFEKIQYPLLIKKLSREWVWREYSFDIIKAVYDKPRASKPKQ